MIRSLIILEFIRDGIFNLIVIVAYSPQMPVDPSLSALSRSRQ